MNDSEKDDRERHFAPVYFGFQTQLHENKRIYSVIVHYHRQYVAKQLWWYKVCEAIGGGSSKKERQTEWTAPFSVIIKTRWPWTAIVRWNLPAGVMIYVSHIPAWYASLEPYSNDSYHAVSLH